MVGGYDAHFYCDCCNDFCEVNGIGVETYQDVIHLMKKDEDKKESWLLRDDGVVLCEKCKTKNPLKLMKENNREGSMWNSKKESLTSNIYVLVPREPTQEIYRKFYDAFNSANAGNTAQSFKVAYKAMIEAQEQDK